MRECLFDANECSITINVCRNDPPFMRSALLQVGDSPLNVGDLPLYVGDPPFYVGDPPLNVGDHPLT